MYPSSKLTFLVIVVVTFSLCVCLKPEGPVDEKVACPDKYGNCNVCIKKGEVIVALTRIICDPYTKELCLNIYNGIAGICDDGCNVCTCLNHGISSTRLTCENDSQGNCTKNHPEGTWRCMSSGCICTKTGIGFIA